MKINHNINALSTINRMKSSNYKLQKSLEKLSTALRINKSADDAAGLTISEKMRGQIRGLEQAQRNIQDGTSLVQVAEGGLNEIHAYLQRIRELSVQAASDTLTVEDRKQIQNQIDQLNKGINEIANNTEFNRIKLLNVEQPDSYYKHHQNNNVEENIPVDPETDPGKPDFQGMYWYGVRFEETGFTDDEFNFAGDYEEIAFNGEQAIIVGSRNYIIRFDGENWHNDTKFFDMQGVQINNFSYVNNRFIDIEWIENENKFVALGIRGDVFTSTDGIDWHQQIESPDPSIEVSGLAYDGKNYIAIGQRGAYEGVIFIRDSASDNWTEVTLDIGEVRRLNSVIWNEKSKEFIAVGWGSILKSTDGVNWEKIDTVHHEETYDVVWGNNEYLFVTSRNIYKLTNDGDWIEGRTPNGKLLSRFHGVTWNEDKKEYVAVGFQPDQEYHSFDGETWIAGVENIWNNYLNDVLWIGDRYLAVGKQTSSSTGIFLSGPPPESEEDQEAFDNVQEPGDTISNEYSNEKGSLILQVGPNSGNHFYVNLTDARTEALGTDTINVETQENASRSISKIDIAIQIISDERSKFGIYQNSLEHIFNNSTNYSENLTAAESRIRDVDYVLAAA